MTFSRARLALACAAVAASSAGAVCVQRAGRRLQTSGTGAVNACDRLDLLFVLDESGSITSPNYERAKRVRQEGGGRGKEDFDVGTTAGCGCT